VLRTLTSSTPAVTSSAAGQTTDFSAASSAITIKVHQVSAMVGRGMGRTVTL
jgi:hypothetical protein